MHNRRRNIMLIAAIAAVLVLGRSLVALGAKPVTWDVDAAKRKADYVWLRGVGADCMDSTDAAMRLIGHAVAQYYDIFHIRAPSAVCRQMYIIMNILPFPNPEYNMKN